LKNDMKQGNLARDTRKLTREEFRIPRFIVEREKPSRYEVQELSPWGSSKTDAVLKSLSGKNFILTRHDKTGAKGRNPNVYAANPRPVTQSPISSLPWQIISLFWPNKAGYL